MNILPFVSTLLLMLFILTFTKLDLFKSWIAIQSKYIYSMKVDEINSFNEIQTQLYKNNKGTPPEENNSTKPARATGTQFLNWYIFLTTSDKTDPIVATTEILTQRVLFLLFQEQSFFQDKLAKNPHFVHELVTKIREKASDPKYVKKIKKITDFASIDLADEELSELFSKMLDCQSISTKALEEIEHAPNSRRRIEKAPKAYQSLKSVTTLNSKSHEIRLFTAQKVLLLAIFEDPHLVEEIIAKRKELYKSIDHLKGASLTVPLTDATREFSDSFKGRIPKNLDPSLFNFTVTKCPPP